MAPAVSLFSVNAILILNTEDGSRVFTKYYSAPHNSNNAQPGHSVSTISSFGDIKAQKAFEKGLLEKTAKQTSDIILYDNRIVLYKCESDVMMYVIGGINENEVMLYNVIVALRDSLHLLFKANLIPQILHTDYLITNHDRFRQTVDKRTVIENYDLVALTVDEIVDDGIILETDSTIIVQRVSKAPTQDVVQLKGIDLSEQGMNNLAQFGKAKLGDWLRQGL
ncbi:SNARE-like protein [Erysiphe pulchra]|uniref:Coatomer subunit zeta n=1 Tax=Erysiphe pulchra TaxID=225359 RepID=A0A2S4PX19_9PEZI|nr:SNARE-like protein [Erysiphe pulchra]